VKQEASRPLQGSLSLLVPLQASDLFCLPWGWMSHRPSETLLFFCFLSSVTLSPVWGCCLSPPHFCLYTCSVFHPFSSGMFKTRLASHPSARVLGQDFEIRVHGLATFPRWNRQLNEWPYFRWDLGLLSDHLSLCDQHGCHWGWSTWLPRGTSLTHPCSIPASRKAQSHTPSSLSREAGKTPGKSGCTAAQPGTQGDNLPMVQASSSPPCTSHGPR
jgi:hypothetical protein